MDNPLKGVPGADLNAVKLAPQSGLGKKPKCKELTICWSCAPEFMFNEPSWVEPLKKYNDHSSNTHFNDEKTATEPNTAPEPGNGIDLEAQVTPDTVTQGKDADFGPQNGATDAEYDDWANYLSDYNTKLKTRNVKTINKRKSNNRFQKRRTIAEWETKKLQSRTQLCSWLVFFLKLFFETVLCRGLLSTSINISEE